MKISNKVINRLSLYHFILDELGEEEKYISSFKIAELLAVDNSQVRKDIRSLGNCGKCRVGYDVKKLKDAIETTLGFKQTRNAFIVGAGNLGSALAKYDSFANYGLNIVAMFDSDKSKIGSYINGKPVFGLERFLELKNKFDADIAILTVPKKAAQQVTDVLVEAKIKYIWNFTPHILKAPDDVKIWNENLIGSFLQFTNNDEKN